ncbi:transporter substrate-binding domain-containing protein [Paraburkholderia rhizosphaerae]|uniref:Glutamate/aspartate transport system substrate-binding protein n=1 Tax=Paraburkholderia rhizosphaerae TaxID=480658 RepID=A0A4R8LRV6_9BURK|nr:transporter substrate-binding domain-containing protein [Paraburkholderia rhizosphaerae]TDY50340.1 glutamate/aspartate transport system substrate-binding protein [Paraburkholderia rhizosphaerae]
MKTLQRKSGCVIPYRVLALLLCGCFALQSHAQDLTGRLASIKARNTIVLGYRESSVPYSYYDNNERVIGYSQDIAQEIVKELKSAINAPNLQVKMIAVNAQNRIPLIQNGTIDLECGGTTNNKERAQQVDFSDTISVTETRLLTRSNSDIHSFKDLNGKTVAVTAGTTSERYLRSYVQQKNADITIIASRDHSGSFMTLETGRAAAFFMDADVLASQRATARNPQDYVVTGEPQTHEAIACMLPKGEAQLKAIADRTIARLETSGQGEALYKTWFMSPIAPKGINLNLPMSDALKAVFQHPNDQPMDD